MRIGLSTYGLDWSFGVEGYPIDEPLQLPRFLEMAAGWGYEGVQIADNAPLAELPASQRQPLWELAAELGLFVEIGARGLTPENLERHVEIACEVGSPILRFVIDGPGFEPSPESIPELLSASAKACERRGIVLAVENHDRFSSRQLTDWFDEVDTPWLGLCLDTVNSYGCGEGYRETIETLLPYTVNFHLKDFRIVRASYKAGLRIVGTPVGEGLLPIESVIERLSKSGKCESSIVEHWVSPEGSVQAAVDTEREWCQRSIHNWRAIVNHD